MRKFDSGETSFERMYICTKEKSILNGEQIKPNAKLVIYKKGCIFGT